VKKEKGSERQRQRDYIGKRQKDRQTDRERERERERKRKVRADKRGGKRAAFHGNKQRANG
jgi:hypothetical protein